MNNVKAIMKAVGRKQGTLQECDSLFHTSLVKAGYMSFEQVQTAKL